MRRHKSWLSHFALATHTHTQKTPCKNNLKAIHTPTRTQTHQYFVMHLQTHICALSKCIHTCKNNKANLIKGVGGEAARQKDINSLSESNKRGGGGSRDKNEEGEKREGECRRERKTYRKS